MRASLRPLLALALLALGFVALAGCGGGDGGSGAVVDSGARSGSGTAAGGAEPLPKQEFVRRGDAICADLRKKAEKLSAEARELGNLSLSEPRNQKAAALIWRKQTALVEELDRRFRALGPAPEGQEQLVADFRGDTARAVALARQITSALDRGEDPSPLVQDYATLIDESNATAGLIGFTVCGAGSA